MDFSNLISNEINKKRKQLNDKNNLKKTKLHNEGISNSVNQSLEIEQSRDEATSVTEQYNDKKNVDLLDNRNDTGLDIKTSGPNDNLEKLGKNDNESKNEPHSNIEDKKERYKKQLESESEVEEIIVKEDIANPKQKDKIYLQSRVYLKHLVNEWERCSTDEDDKTLLLETKKDLVKLLYKLRARKLDDNMLVSLATILYYLQISDYMKANESYMKLSIGNVAWPIGVQNIGIHARSSSLKITGNNTASIMIDTKTRRWVTAVKRLITFSEKMHQDH